MIDPRLFHRITFGVSASLGALAITDGVPKTIKAAAMIFSVGLAAFANAEQLPTIGPMIAQRRASVRASQEMAAVLDDPSGPGAPVSAPMLDDATPAHVVPSEEITSPGVPPAPTSAIGLPGPRGVIGAPTWKGGKK